VNKPRVEHLKAQNKTQIHDQPWTLGLLEAAAAAAAAAAAVDIIVRQRLETKNRIALILLDSNFEIALKEFVVHRTDLFPPKQFTNSVIQSLFEDRRKVVAEVSKQVQIQKILLAKVAHYYSQGTS